MTETLLGVLASIMIVQFSALWYRMGKIEGLVKRINGCLEENRANRQPKGERK